MSGPTPTTPQSLLDLISNGDNFRIPPLRPCQSNKFRTEPVVPFRLSSDHASPAVGLLREPIVKQLLTEDPNVWHFSKNPQGQVDAVSFDASLDTPVKRTNAMRILCERWRDTGLWPEIIGPKKWRGEMYPIYRNPFGALDAPSLEEHERISAQPGEQVDSKDDGNYAFMMERSVCALFGTVTYGVHMTIYHPPLNSDNLRIWVPTRALTKQTWPGYLDNSVAGGIPSGMQPFESLVKESMEEASIKEHIIREHAKATGSISYFYSTKDGWLQPEVEYLYDLCVPPGADAEAFRPKPLDGEVESFDLLPLDEVITRMRAGLFKSNCSLTLIDFLIRHGYVTPDNEPSFMEIITRLHGRFDYERW